MPCQRAARGLSTEPYARPMTLSSGGRCHGRPRSKALNCAGVIDSKGVARAGPDEAPGVEPTCRAPHAEAVAHQQLDARVASVREQVATVRL